MMNAKKSTEGLRLLLNEMIPSMTPGLNKTLPWQNDKKGLISYYQPGQKVLRFSFP